MSTLPTPATEVSAGPAVAPAAVALFRFKVGVMPLLAGSAAAGLVASWLLPLLR